MNDNDIIKGLERYLMKDLIVFWCNGKDNNLMPITIKDILKVINNLKAEAFKEFAEKVKYFCVDSVVFDDWHEESRLIEFIDDLVEEKAGKKQ